MPVMPFGFASILLTLVGCMSDESIPGPDPASVSVCDAVEGEVPEAVLALRGSVIELSEAPTRSTPRLC